MKRYLYLIPLVPGALFTVRLWVFVFGLMPEVPSNQFATGVGMSLGSLFVSWGLYAISRLDM